MPTITIDQASFFQPDTSDGWWNALTKTTSWTTTSFSTHDWVVSYGGLTLEYTSNAGFSTPRASFDIPTGVVDSITVSDQNGVEMSITGLGALGLGAQQLSENPVAIIDNGVTYVGGSATMLVDGGHGSDLFDGSSANDRMNGGAGGPDTVNGAGGDDSITVSNLSGDNVVSGGDGNDSIQAFGATVHGDAGNDRIDISGGTVSGGDGNDTINSTSGLAETLTGDAGDDRFVIGFAGAPTTIDGGTGDDTAVVDWRGGVLTDTQIGNVTLTNVEHVEIAFTSVTGTVTLDASSLTAPVNVTGDAIANHIIGTSGGDTISSGGGGDTVSAGAGADLLDGGNTKFGVIETFGSTPGSPVPHPVFLQVPAQYDFVDYRDAPTGVSVDLNQRIQDTSLGFDAISNFEGVLGSQFNDVLTGSTGQQATDFDLLPMNQFSGSRLYGEGGDDQLFGSSVNDTLVGGAGADTLTGGQGADAFGMTADGSIDRLADFHPGSDGDTLMLTDTSGAALSGVGGMLVLDVSTATLSWDPDGDASPQPAVKLAVVAGGLDHLDASMLAPGFTPSQIEVVTSLGRTVTAFDRTGQAFDHSVGTIDAAGNLVTFDVVYDDGSLTNTWFDNLSSQPWARRELDTDAHGQETVYAYVNDDGSEVIWNFDVNNTHDWQRLMQTYGADGSLLLQSSLSDDGTADEIHYDHADQTYTVDHFAVSGALVSHHTFRDDGTIIS